MAQNISSKQAEFAVQNAFAFNQSKKNKFLKKILFYLVFNSKLLKRFFFYLTIKFISKIKKDDINIQIGDWSIQKKDLFKEKGYLYFENFIEQEIFEKLLNNWPNINFFTPRLKPIKFYDTGFVLGVGKKIYLFSNPEDLHYFKHHYSLYSYFKSEKMCNMIKKLYGSDKNFYLKGMVYSNASKNSFLIPHKDGLPKDKKEVCNLIFFVDGDNEDTLKSGGTSLYFDNEFEKLIFKPNNICNSLLLYNSNFNFFHGFKKIETNKNRKAITFEYSEI